MARSFRPVVRDQPFLIAPDMREWLPADHLVWFVLDAVNALDVSAFRARRRLGGAGRAPYDPVMLLALLIYGYAVGQRSSRQLERLCGVDVAFRIICGNDAPDHVTIARFRAEQQDGLESLFEQILVLCARAGMGRLGVVALDGTKIAANAAPGANRSEKWLRGVARQWLDEAAAADAAEDEAFGAARGDELPAELAEPRGRPARIRQILDELDRERAADTSSRGAQRVDHGAERVRQAQDRLQRARADRQRQVDDRAAREAAAHAAAGRRLSGRTPQGGEQIEGYCRVRDARDALERAEQTYQRATQSRSARTMRNLTDPECRLMPSRSGWLVGYNAQLLVSADHLILAAELTQQPADSQSFPPMLAAATNTLTRVNAAAGTGWRLGCVLADAGYASEENFTCPGPNRLIALGTHHDVDRAARHHATDGPPPAEASPREHMRHRLRTPFGAALYAQRGAIVEPVNAHLKDRRGLRRFSRRGLTAARSELRFAAAITNLLRLHTHLATATG